MSVEIRGLRLWTLRCACLALVLFLADVPRGFATTQMITTTYLYDQDAAPTAVTTQVDAQPATTIYLTWDNFTPNSAAPTTGTVSAADGNLVGIGPSPGTTALTTQFAYDSRDRLTACSPVGQPSVSYAYHPASLMASSTLASGDALQFYYNNAATPLMVNTRQPSTDLTASFLGPVRYLSDGSEQVLLQPRKDTAGVYDAAAQSLAAYSYDPYGAPLSTSTASSGLSSDGTAYDLTQNPFQYGGQYQDPTCSAYYLRARWYLPAQQTFLSRDPADPLHRYSYTAGNPVGRSDPSGLKYTGEDFSRDVDKAVHKLTPGISAYIEPLLPVWGQVLGGAELVGLLPSFWHHPTTEGIVTFGFLAASIVAEVGGETKTFDSLFATSQRALGARIGFDVVLGGSQTAAQSYRHGRVDVPALIQGIDTTAFGIFYARAVAGVGYRPYNLTADEVENQALSHLSAHDDLLIFRARTGVLQSSGQDLPFTNTSPLLEDLHLAVYHEGLIAYGRDAILHSDLTVDDAGYARVAYGEVTALSPHQQYLYVGSVPATEQNIRAMQASPLGIPLQARRGSAVSIDSQGVDLDREQYSMFSRNCQKHSAAVRRQLGL